MFGRTPGELEWFLWQNISLLLFIERREADLAAIKNRLEKRGRYSASGIVGALRRNKRPVTFESVAVVFKSIYKKIGISFDRGALSQYK